MTVVNFGCKINLVLTFMMASSSRESTGSGLGAGFGGALGAGLGFSTLTSAKNQIFHHDEHTDLNIKNQDY